MADITCTRCGATGAPLERAPLKTELGQRIQAEICRSCWDEWLRYQTALINHYGLDVRDREAREFLTRNMEAFLFKSGEDTEDIDTSQQGNIAW